jgi:hypothetical protein
LIDADDSGGCGTRGLTCHPEGTSPTDAVGAGALGTLEAAAEVEGAEGAGAFSDPSSTVAATVATEATGDAGASGATTTGRSLDEAPGGRVRVQSTQASPPARAAATNMSQGHTAAPSEAPTARMGRVESGDRGTRTESDEMGASAAIPSGVVEAALGTAGEPMARGGTMLGTRGGGGRLATPDTLGAIGGMEPNLRSMRVAACPGLGV